MRRYLYFIILLFSLPVYAQRTGIKLLPIEGHVKFAYTLKTNQEIIIPEGWNGAGNVVLPQTLSDGFILGKNEYGDLEKGQVFRNQQKTFIYGTYMLLGAIEGTSGNALIRIRSFNQSPGRILAEVEMNISDMLARRDSSGSLYVAFDHPVFTGGDYMLSIGLAELGNSSLGMIAADGGGTSPMLWEKRNDQRWNTVYQGWKGIEPGLNMGVFPVTSLRSEFAGGTGTKSDPYQVADASQLNMVRDYPASWFIQVADIQLDVSPWSDGAGWNPIGGEGNIIFTGSYNGNDFVISGLRIVRPETDYIGLFGKATSAEFKNITLTDVEISGRDYTGALAGHVLEGSIHNVQMDGTVQGYQFTGGLLGSATGLVVENCSAQATVLGYAYAGGLAGVAKVEHCSSGGTVNGLDDDENTSFRIGGLLGEGFALNSHSTATVTGTHEVGGLIGKGSAYGSYATGDVTGSGDYIGGLIGDLGTGEDDFNTDEYTPGEPALSDTTTIRDTITGNGGGPLIIILEDETRVLVPGNGTPLKVDVIRMDQDEDFETYIPEGSGLRPTGSMRFVKIKGEGDPTWIKPVITIPLSEAGTLDPVTLVILRVGDLYVDGDLIENHSVILPVITIDENGLKFVDAVFPDALVPFIGIQGEPDDGQLEQAWVGDAKYFVMSFDKSLNWAQRPILERMVPDSTLTSSGFRKLASKMSQGAQKELLKQPVCNVVILVHGHNEEEKDGYVDSRIDGPWNFRYKRILWDLLYEEVLTGDAEDYPLECTAFYEFISPTYRPIFSPVPNKTTVRHITLGEDLARLVNDEFENNKQLKAMIESDMPFNLYIVTHSQGGLVVRAGLRLMSDNVLKHLKKVVTWGSPHHGAGLFSLRYALAVGHNIVIDGFEFPMQNIGQSQAYQSFVSALALDAPGIRDLRWDASKKSMMRFGDLFQENPTTLNEFVDTELPDGKLFYSDNLNIFNQNEGLFVGSYLKDKYIFYHGITPKDAPLEFTSGWNPFRKFIYFAKHASDIQKGSQLNKLVFHDPNKASDGASPVFSQGGNAIWGNGGIQRRSFDDMDHEEFYGAEPPNRNELTIAKGRSVTTHTLTDLGFDGLRSQCAEIEVEREVTVDSLFLVGEVVYPIYDPAQGGDGLPGERIVRMEARIGNPQGALIPGLIFAFKPDGKFTAKGRLNEIPLSSDTLVIVAVLKDSSEIRGFNAEALPWTKCSIDFQIRFGEVEYTSFPSMWMDTTFETIGHSTWTSGNDVNLGEFNGKTFTGTSENGRETITVTLDATGTKVEYFEFSLDAPYAKITLSGHDIPNYEFYPGYFFISAAAQTCNYVTNLNYWNSNEWGSFRLLSYSCVDDLNYIHIFFDP